MLTFLFDNKEIDFDGVVTLQMLNPIFNSSVSHSFNCKTVLTARTKEILNNLHLPEVGYALRSVSATLITDAFTFRGSAYFTSITGQYLDFQFVSQNDFWNKAEAKLRTLSLTFNAKYFPVYNEKLMDDFTLVGDAFSNFANALNLDGVPLNNETTAPIPFLKLNTIIADIFKNFNISLPQNIFASNPDLALLYLLNLNSNGRYYHPDVVATNTNSFKVGIDNGQFTFESDAPHEIIDKSYCLLTAYIRPIEAQYQFNNKVLQVSVIDQYHISFPSVTPFIDAVTGNGWMNYIIVKSPKYNGLLSEQAKNHVPDTTAKEFLTQLENLFCCRFFVDESEKECRVLFLKDILKSNDVIDISAFAGEISDQPLDRKNGYSLSFENPADDEYWSSRINQLTSLMTVKSSVPTASALPMQDCTENDVRMVLDEKAWYRYEKVSFTRNAGWKFYSEDILSLETGEKEFEIKSKFAPALTSVVNGFTYITLRQKADFMIMNKLGGDVWRLFFHRADRQLIRYGYTHIPLCTNDVYDTQKNKIAAANLALKWDGEYGLFNQLHKHFVDLMVNKYRQPVCFINWPGHMLNSFPWWRKHRINHQNFLVHTINLEITQSATTMKDTVLVPV